MAQSRHSEEVSAPRRGLYGRGLPEAMVDALVFDEVMATEIPFARSGPFALRGFVAVLNEDSTINAKRYREYREWERKNADDFLQSFRDTRTRVARGLRKLRRERDRA